MMLISSTTEVLLSAEAKAEDNTKPEMRVVMVRLLIIYSGFLLVCSL